VFDLCQFIDKEIGSRTGAHSHNAIGWNMRNRRLRDRTFKFILAHSHVVKIE